VEWDIETLDSDQAYRLMNSLIVPRPIAWVGTLSPDGRPNLAPFSYFNGVGSEPPALSISIAGRREGGPKDTLRNIQDTGEFTVSSVPFRLAEAMNKTSAELPYGESEFAAAGVTPSPSAKVKAPGVLESPARWECRLIQVVPVGGSSLVIGRIVHLFLDDAALSEARPGRFPTADPGRLDAVARLGGESYARITDRFDLKRPRKA
jgi:flavin reductase (DIM6/NTAB) family NADH-FMN oxidoreductase RutF